MFDFNDPNICVQMCKFQADIQKAHVVIKFPCSYFVQWRTINNRYSICTQTRVRAANDQAVFNQKLTFYTEMVFNSKKKEYYSKQTFLVLNLVSKSRPDQIKLVGRISIDLADIMNRKRFSQFTHVKLNYCSVQGSIVFKINLLNKRDSNLSVKDLDRSAFTDYFSLNPINRMMIQQSIGTNYAAKTLNQNQKVPSFAKKSQNSNYEQNNIQSNNNYNTVPSFAPVQQQRLNSFNRQQQVHNRKSLSRQKDQEIISFNNNSQNQGQPQNQSHRETKFNKNQSSRTQSKEQSLIEKLEEKNLMYGERQRGNVVQLNSRQPKTDRFNSAQNQGPRLMKNNSSKKFLTKVPQQVQGGQIKKQSVVQKNNFSTNPTASIQKPTSPPSKQRTLNHVSSQSKFSQTSQHQNQQLLSIVTKLQNQKKQQQQMIQSLRSMILNKDMKKKKEIPSVIQTNGSQMNNREKQLLQQNNLLRNDNSQLKQEVDILRQSLNKKDNQLSEKNRHIYELLDKIKRLQKQIAQASSILGYQQEQIKKNQVYFNAIKNDFKNKLSLQINPPNLSMSSSYPQTPGFDRQNSLNNQLVDKTKNVNNNQDIVNTEQYQIQSPIKITVTKDDHMYDEIQKQNNELYERIKQLEQENEKYRELMKNDQLLMQNSLSSLKYSTNTRDFIINPPPKMQTQQIRMTQSLQQPKSQKPLNKISSATSQPEFRITISKNHNIYENYQNLQQQNGQLYQRIKQLEEQIEKYKDLLKTSNQQDGSNNKGFQFGIDGLIGNIAQMPMEQNVIHEEFVYQNEDNQSKPIQQNAGNLFFGLLGVNGNKNTQKQVIIGTQDQNNSLKHVQSQQKPQSSQPLQHALNFIGQTFKIIVTKDKDIYKQQQQQNIQLSKRVIQLQEQIEKYRDIVKQHTSSNQNRIPSQYDNNLISQKRNSIEEQQQYEDVGFKINLVKDKNIFENQQTEIDELSRKIQQLQEKLKKYKNLYGQLPQQTEYKISITREENIYQDQQRQIKDLLKTLDIKDDQIMELMKRISILEAELYEFRPKSDNGESMIKINIKRDQNIYDEQESQIKYLSSQVIELEDKLAVVERELKNKQMQVQELNKNKQKQIKSLNNLSNNSASKPVTPHIASNKSSNPQACANCSQLTSQLQQLKMNIQLVQQQKSLLQQQIGALQQQKFCLNSSQNELKIKIQQLQQELSIYKQQNQRYSQQLHYYQQVQQGLVNEGENYLEGEQYENNQQQGNYQHQHQQYRHQVQQVQQHKIISQIHQQSAQQINPYESIHSNKNNLTTNLLNRQNSGASFNRQTQMNQTLNNSTAKVLDILHQENSQLRQKLTLFQQQLEQQYMTITELEDRIARLMHEKEILGMNQAELGEQVERKNREIQKLNKNVEELKTQIQELKKLSNKNNPSNLNNNEQNCSFKLTQHLPVSSLLQTSITPSNYQQILLQKQQQISSLKRQIQQINFHLISLTQSYESLQQMMFSVQTNKKNQVELIKKQSQHISKIVRNQLDVIEKIIVEKQKISLEQSLKMKKLALETKELAEENQKLKGLIEEFNNNNNINSEQKERMTHIQEEVSKHLILQKEQINALQKEIHNLTQQNINLRNIIQSQRQSLASSETKVSTTQSQLSSLLQQIQSVSSSKSNCERHIQELRPLLQQKINSITPRGDQQIVVPEVVSERVINQEQLSIAKRIYKQIQKIKVNIMKGNTNSSSVFNTVNKSASGPGFKTFAQKNAMLNYFKPLEQLLKDY